MSVAVYRSLLARTCWIFNRKGVKSGNYMAMYMFVIMNYECLFSLWTDFIIYQTGGGTLSCMVSSSLRRIQGIFCNWCHIDFSFHQIPITAGGTGGTGVAWNERFAQHLHTWVTTSVHVTHISAGLKSTLFNWQLGIWWQLVNVWPYTSMVINGWMFISMHSSNI